MKLIFTSALACLTILTSSAQIESCPAGTDTNAIPKFSGVPSLVSGSALQQGAVYRYENVVTSPFTMYALVKIENVDKAKVVNIDERDLSNAGNDNRFQPQIAPDNTTLNGDRRGLITFSMTFYSAATNLPAPITGLRFTHYDMDGFTNGTTGWYREMGCVTNATGIITSSNPATQLLNAGDYTANGYLWKQYMGSTTEHGGVSSDPEVALVAEYLAASSVVFRMGYDFKKGNGSNLSSPSYRQYAAKFGCFSFVNGGTMPVTYSSFDAVVNDKSVLVKWITAQEMNNSHFEVERSFNNTDFTTAGIVLDGFAVNGTGKSYQFKDNSPALQEQPVAYYRLKQIDVDGKATYTKVLVVRLQAKPGITMQVSPNPFAESLNLRFNAAASGTAEIRIVNNYGQTLLSKQATISKGFNTVQVDGLNGLTPGMYIAQLIMNGTVIDNQRVIKN
ncbi:MAG TPA: T9SS type A sorting domain-containing protein [Ferruginibacter sp.]|nr:T9SS type A sorting domain-containing protein [Ferruginibacter sp.]